MDLADSWPLPSGVDLRDELLAAWHDPSRRYHDARHLAEVLERIAELAAGGAMFHDRAAVMLAAWFHDAVYDGERDAEERSAVWAEAALPEHVDAATVAEVARLVRLTETHRPEEDDPDGCVLSDADLAILAAPADRYAEYVAAVREEYAHVPDDAFTTGRTAVLRDLLGKPHLFHTAYARQRWEDAARANMQAELEGLGAG